MDVGENSMRVLIKPQNKTLVQSEHGLRFKLSDDPEDDDISFKLHDIRQDKNRQENDPF